MYSIWHVYKVQIYKISFSCLIDLAQTSRTLLNRSGESGHSCLGPDLRGKTFSPLSMMLAEGLSCMVFIMLRYFPSIPILLSSLIINECCILSNAHCGSIDKIIWFLSFVLLMWYITLINLHMLNHSHAPGRNPTRSWCISF